MAEAFTPWLHILAATVWVGPQFFLFIAAIPALRTIEDMHIRARAMRVLTTRFGYLAWGAMAVLVVTGIGSLFEHDTDLDILFDRNYGTIFIVKMVLVGAVVALTALHTFVVGPRLLDLQEKMSDEAELAPARRTSIIVSASSLLLALGILFCGALLRTEFAFQT